MDSKESEEHSLVKNKHGTLNGGHKKIVRGGPKVREPRKVFRKVMEAFRKVGFALINRKRLQAMISHRTKAEARIKKERVRKVLILNLDFQPQKQKDMAMPGNQTIGIPALLTIPLVRVFVELLHGIARDILHGWHQSL